MTPKTFLFISISNSCPVGCACDDRTPEQKKFFDDYIKECNEGAKLKPKKHKGSAIYLPPRKY